MHEAVSFGLICVSMVVGYALGAISMLCFCAGYLKRRP
jgi:hypothetical protein